MDLTSLIQSGSVSPVFLMAAAIVLGALHGLEPGHSKTMMAAFIIAVRGTVSQAILLGLSAALSHTAIVWILALIALSLGNELIGEELEPVFMMASGGIIIVMGAWIFIQQWRRAKKRAAHSHGHHHGHGHNHGHSHNHDHSHDHDHSHGHDHLDDDAHARAHAREIEERFGDGSATTGQTILFGLTGGLIPCSAAITVLILCLNLQQFWLGVTLVAGFSIGLAVMLVAVGSAAAIGMNYVLAKSGAFDRFMDRAPYVSAVLIVLVGLAMLYTGWHQAPHH
ncbi:nickel/cobalt efflux transporter [Coralliovum pocilloporae]|uniref:nickel/cobalt efflux transporter n=1 Tax=Coralliovum pocilloporae TaxID=3066369 RepID=UPI0033079CD3